MKGFAWVLGSFLLLSLASAPALAAGPLDGIGKAIPKAPPITNPVEETTKKVKEVVDEVSKPVEETTKKVKEVVDQVAKATDEVAKATEEVAKGGGGTAGNATGASQPSGSTPAAAAPSGSKVAPKAVGSRTGVARASNRRGKARSRSTRENPEQDVDEVAAAGNTIEPARVKGTQIIAPATDEDAAGGSDLSRTGAQILGWLVVASWLLGIGSALVWRARTRVGAISS
jgi:hypothetical protein